MGVVQESDIRFTIDAAEKNLRAITGSTTAPDIQLDKASFSNVADPERVKNYLNAWSGWYVFDRLVWVYREFADQLQVKAELAKIKKIVLVHDNKGLPDGQRVKCDVASGTVTLTASFCCYWHGPQYDEMFYTIGRDFDLLIKGYMAVVEKTAIPEANEEIFKEIGKKLDLSVDWKTFDYPDLKTKEYTMRQLAYWRGYYSFRYVSWAIYYAVRWDDIKGEEIAKMLDKVVLRNVPGTDYNKKKVDFSFRTKTLYLDSVWENDWWGRVYEYDIRNLIVGVARILRLGNWPSMTQEQHEAKMTLLEYIATGSSVNLDYFKKILKFPCFVPTDNHDVLAFRKAMEFINTGAYQKEVLLEAKEYEESDDDDSDDESPKKKEEVAEPNPDEIKEKFIKGWNITKVSWRGEKSQRLVMVTDKATYLFNYDYSSKKVVDSKIHLRRVAHKFYDFLEAGEREMVNQDMMAGGSMGTWTGPKPNLPGVDLPNMPGAPESVKNAAAKAGDAAGAAADKAKSLAPDVNLPSIRLPKKDFAVRYVTTKPRKGKKKPKFSMPKIPNIKEKICEFFKKMIQSIKNAELPEFKLPKPPSFDFSKIMEFIEKAVRGGKDKVADAASSATSGVSGPGEAGENSCATGAAGGEDVQKISAITEGLKKCPEKKTPKLPGMPDLNPANLLESIVEKIKGLADIEIGLPKEANLPSAMKGLLKSLKGKKGMPGLDMPKMPNLGVKDALIAIKDSFGDMKLPDIPPFSSLSALIDEVANSAFVKACKAIEFPDFPKLSIKKTLKSLVIWLGSVKLPKIDLDITAELNLPKPGLPSCLPAMPAIKSPIQGAKAPKVAKAPPNVEMILFPRVGELGGEEYVAYEIAWTLYVAARECNRPYSPSWPRSVKIEVAQNMMGKIVNAKNKGEHKMNKPDGSGDPVDDSDVEAEVPAGAK